MCPVQPTFDSIYIFSWTIDWSAKARDDDEHWSESNSSRSFSFGGFFSIGISINRLIFPSQLFFKGEDILLFENGNRWPIFPRLIDAVITETRSKQNDMNKRSNVSFLCRDENTFPLTDVESGYQSRRTRIFLFFSFIVFFPPVPSEKWLACLEHQQIFLTIHILFIDCVISERSNPILCQHSATWRNAALAFVSTCWRSSATISDSLTNSTESTIPNLALSWYNFTLHSLPSVCLSVTFAIQAWHKSPSIIVV